MNNPYNVTLASVGDAEQIFAILSNLHEENGIFRLSPEKVRGEILKAVNYDRTAPMLIGLIKDEKGKIEGIAWLALVSDWYTDDFFWGERLIYVVPECRRSTHAKRLIGFAKWVSDQMCEELGKFDDLKQPKVPLIIGIMTQKNLESKMRLYQRQIPQMGATFIYNWELDKGFFNQRHLNGQ